MPTSPSPLSITIYRTAPGNVPGEARDANLLLPQPGWDILTLTYTNTTYTIFRIAISIYTISITASVLQGLHLAL